MELYNHFAIAEKFATRLKAIGHSPENPKCFKAYGLEDLFNFDDRLSSLNGYILIAVDGHESDSSANRSDGLTDTRHYAYIVARNTISDRTETIESAFAECRKLCKQIRNALLQDESLLGYLNRDTQINGIGPIGDNFYGCMLSISVDEPENYFVDDSYWEQ